jgi:alpha-tubulin suppressor-like RCC1 family protein
LGIQYFGQVGYEPGTGNTTVPTQVDGLDGVIALAGGNGNSFALLDDGTVWAWGDNQFGQLGTGQYWLDLPYSITPVQVLNLTGVIAIACGGDHILALKADGTVWTWGNNQHGQLGIGTYGYYTENIPVQVHGINGEGFLTDITTIAAGYHHNLAIDFDGNFYSWGSNASGELGDGTKILRATPVHVNGINDVVSIDAGWGHSLAITEDGTAWTWGRNDSGQLGDGTNVSKLSPVQVMDVDGNGVLTDVTAIASGHFHNLAVLTSGAVVAWGRNGSGQLGDGTTTHRNVPVDVKGLNGVGWLTDVDTLAAGHSHSLAIKNDGRLYTWGSNSRGQLGNGRTWSSSTPVHLNGLSNVSLIAAGWQHSLAVGIGNTPTGTDVAVHFSENEAVTHDITLTFDDVTMPGATVLLPTTFGPTAPSGYTFGSPPAFYYTATSAIFSDNVTICIHHPGVSESDKLFQSETTLTYYGTSFSPIIVDGEWIDITTLVDVDSGMICGLAASLGGFAIGSEKIITDGPYSWGLNASGQLGDGTTNLQNSPMMVNGLDELIAVAAGGSHSLALKADGTVWAWGDNTHGQLGDGTNTTSYLPVQVSNLTDVTAIAAGQTHSLALKNDGTVWSWGSNLYKQLASGDANDRNSPVQVIVEGYWNDYLSNVISIATGQYHNLALSSDGKVWVWGWNDHAQLGDGSTTTRITPIENNVLVSIVAIAAGQNHSLAVKEDGTLWAWGDNEFGQLGNGTTDLGYWPTQVLNIDNVIAVDGGLGHTLALKSDATLWAWGMADFSQLGGDTFDLQKTPLQVSGLNNIMAISSGYAHNLAISNDGTVWAWGDNTHGQLGIGTGGSGQYSNAPVQVNDLFDVVAISGGNAHSLAIVDIPPTDNTPTGDTIIVQPVDESTSTTPVTLTFDEITAPGTTTLTITSDGPTAPNGFSIGDPPVYYHLETTAEFSGSVTICIQHPGLTEADRLFHYEGDAWVDVTTTVDLVEGTICGVVTSFSPFVVATPLDQEGPQITSVFADPNPAPIATMITLSATIDDSQTGGSDIAWAEYSLDNGATWHSMDGTFDSPTTDVSVEIEAFSEPQVVEILIRAADALGNEGNPASVLLAVYDPSAGFVTGGGWIWSPEGAYAPQPELTGQATFGFVSRYKKGQSTPDGNTQFQFHAGDLTFRSTDYEWLVIAGSRAQFKGSGMVNGEGNYGFMLTAIDGDLTQSQDFDSFRIKIWDKASGTIIYDNQMGMSDSDDSATELGGGSIVIHDGTKKK